MHTTTRTFVAGFVAFLAVLSGINVATWAGGLGCRHCGQERECRKVCRLECVDKKIVTTCWTVQDEDFCLPGPSCPGCSHSESVCDECDEFGNTPAFGKIRFWREWFPNTCGQVFTRRKLMKKTVTKTIPGYKWVVEDLCPACEADCEVVTPPANVLIPPAPAGESVPVIGGHSPPETVR